jgi:hypothetical protein
MSVDDATARHLLESLVERLAPKVGSAVYAHSAYYGDVITPDLRDRIENGYLFLQSAFRHARAALASADPEHILQMTPIIMSYERDGLMLENAFREKQRQLQARVRLRKGGTSHATQQRAQATRIWKPYQEMYRSLVEAGADPAIARRTVTRKMRRDRFKLPYQKRDTFPTDPTIRKWLK